MTFKRDSTSLNCLTTVSLFRFPASSLWPGENPLLLGAGAGRYKRTTKEGLYMGLEDKSSSYLFWLSEYLARKLLINIGPDAAVLLCFFEIGEMHSKGLADDLKYQPTPRAIAAFIESGTWKNPGTEWAQRFGESFLEALPGMRDEIDRLAAYIPANEDEIKLALQLGADPLDAETIVLACMNGKVPDLMAQRFHGSAYAFTDMAVTAFGGEGAPLRLGYSKLDVQGGMLQLHDVRIDLAAHLQDILADVTALVCSGREEAAFNSLGIEDNPQNPQWGKALGELYKNGCPGYGPCSNGKCQIDERYSLAAKVLRKSGAGGYAYSPRSDSARAVGLWLWGYVQESGCSVAAAVRAIKQQDFLNTLQFSASPDRVFERIYTKTKKCIEQGEVFSMS